MEKVVAPLLVVAVQLAIAGDDGDLVFTARTLVAVDLRGEVGSGEVVGVVRDLWIERDACAQRRIVEENGHALAIGQTHEVRLGGVYRPLCLPGRQYGVGDAAVMQGRERL